MDIRRCALAGLAMAAGLVPLQAPAVPGDVGADPSPAERQAILEAAGFKLQGGRLVGCDTEPDWPRSDVHLRQLDLNADGRPEALVEEGNVACYGNTGQAFQVLTRDAAGRWHRVASEVGIPNVLDSRRMGWADIEVGGPGLGPMPILHWDGREYR